MTEQKMNELYNQFKPMLHKHARKFSNIYGVEYEECISEGNLIFVECCNAFDENKACFSTYFYINLERKLYEFTSSYSKHGAVESWPENVLYNEVSYNDNFVQLIELNESLQSISNIAQYIVKITFNPSVILNSSGQNSHKIWDLKITKKKIENYLMEVNHYTRQSIRTAFSEIKEAIN